MLTVILSGGSSRRMGQDKASLPIDSSGRGMRDELVQRYCALGSVAVSVDKAGRYTGTEPELPDEFPGMGPLNGINSAFEKTDADYIFLTATDIINGDPKLAQYLENALGSHDACVIRRENGHLEPLFAIYTRACGEIARAYLAVGRRSMLNVINAVNTKIIDERDLPQWDLERVLMNINTPEDYERFKSQ